MKKITAILLCFHISLSLSAFKNIEISKKEIASTLKNNPIASKKFKMLCQQYDTLVVSFFDTDNNLSLAQHITLMEKDLCTLNSTAHDQQFIGAREMLLDLNKHLQAMVTLLKKYTSSRNTVGLAFKVRRFKNLLPHRVNKKTEFSLFWALHHRLSC